LDDERRICCDTHCERAVLFLSFSLFSLVFLDALGWFVGATTILTMPAWFVLPNRKGREEVPPSVYACATCAVVSIVRPSLLLEFVSVFVFRYLFLSLLVDIFHSFHEKIFFVVVPDEAFATY